MIDPSSGASSLNDNNAKANDLGRKIQSFTVNFLSSDHDPLRPEVLQRYGTSWWCCSVRKVRPHYIHSKLVCSLTSPPSPIVATHRSFFGGNFTVPNISWKSSTSLSWVHYSMTSLVWLALFVLIFPRSFRQSLSTWFSRKFMVTKDLPPWADKPDSCVFTSLTLLSC